jgi:2-oxo-4-hydroxy-4-carboxy-5-ureidoimidazoline decarboxylase
MATPEDAAPDGLGLARLNALPAAQAERVLRRCCASGRWAAEVAAGRPYAREEDLYAAADAALHRLDEHDLDQALAAHPRIGERPRGEEAAWSRREQSAVSAATDDTLAALAEGNRAYEARFGHVYLVCAADRGADELLAVLRQRLHNDPETERRVLRAELAKINRIRLGRLVGEEEAA